MIAGLAAAFIIAALLLIAVHRYDLPEIPLYLLSGIILSFAVQQGLQLGLIKDPVMDQALLQELAYLGLGIMVFFATTRFALDTRRKTAVDSFKASIWVSTVSFCAAAGLLSFMGFPPVEAAIFGVVAAFSSSLVDSKIILDEARSNHIHGWLTEDINIYQDIIAVLTVASLFAVFTNLNALLAFITSLVLISAALIVRGKFSELMLSATGKENELLMLLGIVTPVLLVLISEGLGLTAVTGLIAAGLVFTDTDLGFRVRERLSGIQDFFTAVAFFSIGSMVSLPEPRYFIAAVGLTVFVSVLRPVLSALFLQLQGYDLRTSFLVGVQTNEVSEISMLAALMFSPLISVQAFSAVVTVFAASIIISHLFEQYRHELFEKILSDYEFDPEKMKLPDNLEDHVIIAGFDDKTQGIAEKVEAPVVVIDYDMEKIEEAEKSGLYHVLGDLNLDETWSRAGYSDASVIVSAASRTEVMEKIRDLETDAGKVLVDHDKDSEQIHQKLREMLSEALK